MTCGRAGVPDAMSADRNTPTPVRDTIEYARTHGIRDTLARLIEQGTVEKIDNPVVDEALLNRIHDDSRVDCALLDFKGGSRGFTVEYATFTTGVWFNVTGKPAEGWQPPAELDHENSHPGGVLLSAPTDPREARAELECIATHLGGDLSDCQTARLRDLNL